MGERALTITWFTKFTKIDSWLLKVPDFFSSSNADGENEFPDSSSELDDTLQDENDICTPVIDCKTASLYASELIKYGLTTNHGAVANVLLKFQLDIQTDHLNKKLKQTTIDKFFNQA